MKTANETTYWQTVENIAAIADSMTNESEQSNAVYDLLDEVPDSAVRAARLYSPSLPDVERDFPELADFDAARCALKFDVWNAITKHF